MSRLGKYDFPKPGEEALRLLGRITEIVTEVTGPDGTVTHSPSELYILMDLSASLSNFSMQSTVNFLDPLLREVCYANLFSNLPGAILPVDL